MKKTKKLGRYLLHSGLLVAGPCLIGYYAAQILVEDWRLLDATWESYCESYLYIWRIFSGLQQNTTDMTCYARGCSSLELSPSNM